MTIHYRKSAEMIEDKIVGIYLVLYDDTKNSPADL